MINEGAAPSGFVAGTVMPCLTFYQLAYGYNWQGDFLLAACGGKCELSTQALNSSMVHDATDPGSRGGLPL